MDSKEIFRLSKPMMDGNKFATWVLELSFIGWYLLGVLCCCIGGFFVNPYYEATLAELYLKLREDRLGIARNGAHAPVSCFQEGKQKRTWRRPLFCALFSGGGKAPA